MKKLFILCIAATMFACKQDPKIDYALFSGKIENPTDKTVIVFDGREKVKEMVLSENGTFADTLKIESGYYTLRHGKESSTIYLDPENDIDMTLNTKSFDETLKYSGKGSENNNYLAAKFLADEKSNIDYAKTFALDEADFLKAVNDIKNSKQELLNNAKNISDQFRALEQKNTEYEYLANLQNYKSYHHYYAKKAMYKPSEDFNKIINNVDYNNAEDYAILGSYKRLALSHYSNKIGDSDNPKEVFEDINQNTFPALKDDLAKKMIYEISPNNEHNEAYYNGLMALSSDEDFKNQLTTKFNTVNKLSKGKPSPKFTDYENHKGGTTSLDDLMGKYVYIDVWATWCGPCIREIPSLKEVEKQFHNKNIEFVSVSIDNDAAHDKWVTMVKEKELGGIQLIADNDWNSKFVKDYAIQGIPRFILIDPEGKIVNADAPRPSDPKLVELFIELKI
ncbi:TlpA family protein disulfide reductase [Winogradskyella pulchriflava]|uniref:TlpA family protein disulfide reductase n=1 Tax=Winogradskyella pulchriflava TaxID=1110688 RepID=A0ABV6QC15_9FLAO